MGAKPFAAVLQRRGMQTEREHCGRRRELWIFGNGWAVEAILSQHVAGEWQP